MEIQAMIRSMLGPRSSAALSIPERAEHIVALRAHLHATEAEEVTLIASVEKMTGDHLLNEKGPAAAEIEKAQAALDKATAAIRILRLAIARLEREQAAARETAAQADYRAHLERVKAGHQHLIEKAAAAETLVLDAAAAVMAMKVAQKELGLEIGLDLLANFFPWMNSGDLLALEAWASTDGVWPPAGMTPSGTPHVIGERLRPITEQWRELGPRILALVPRPSIAQEATP